jgi:hypothetical protein
MEEAAMIFTVLALLGLFVIGFILLDRDFWKHAIRQQPTSKLCMLDRVTLLRQVREVPAGAQGTIVYVYGHGEAYEVEFLDKAGDTFDVLTLKAEDLLPMKGGHDES